MSQEVVGRMMGRNQLWVMRAEKTGRISFVSLEHLAAIYQKPLSYFETLDLSAIRIEGNYLGLANAEWKRLAAQSKLSRVAAAPTKHLEERKRP